MALLDWLTALALALPQQWQDTDEPQETMGERSIRVAMIAHAVHEATATDAPKFPGLRLYGKQEMAGYTHKQRAVMVLAKLYHESTRFSKDVHAGASRGDSGRSVCLGQIMRGWWIPSKIHESLAGLDYDATKRCVTVAYVALAHHKHRCVRKRKPSQRAVASIYAGYGTGYSCNPELEFAVKRSRHWAQLMGVRPDQ